MAHGAVTTVVVPAGGETRRPVVPATPQPRVPVWVPLLNVIWTGWAPQTKVAEKTPPPQMIEFWPPYWAPVITAWKMPPGLDVTVWPPTQLPLIVACWPTPTEGGVATMPPVDCEAVQLSEPWVVPS